ncbi:MAG: alpha/beta hydrolase [Bacillota bacterium]|nr:alpha/beta hydrolase [Bacillota bacterium]
MNETSSKFVDVFAMEKLINEKLTKVSHSPINSIFKSEDISFEGLDEFKLEIENVKIVTSDDGATYYVIPSYCKSTHYKENNMINLYYYPSKTPECNILLLHGLFDDNMSNYQFTVRQLNDLNFNVYFMVLPYHFNRKPQISKFSGEFFLSADVYRSRNAFKQAIFDTETSMQFIKEQNKLPNMLAGFSMGGCIAFRYYLLKNQSIRTFLFNPVTDLTKIIWDNPLLLTVGKDLAKSGFDTNIYTNLFKELDPCENISSKIDEKKVAMVYSVYDQIIEENKYKKFINKTGIKNVLSYSAGHLNVLRVPRLSKDIKDFFKHD